MLFEEVGILLIVNWRSCEGVMRVSVYHSRQLALDVQIFR